MPINQSEIDRLYAEAQKIGSQIPDIQTQVDTLTSAKAAGMAMTPQTSSEQAQQYITSQNIQPVNETDFKPPAETPVYNVAGLDTTTNPDLTPSLTKTPEETQAQSMTEQLIELNKSLVGESAYRTEQEGVQGVPALQKTQNELTTQLNTLKNEALAIPQQMQLDATGRGITAGGLRPLETARLRTNAIAALGINSLLTASQGNLALAQDMVDRAVAQKYDPIREQIAAATANLNLILNSPDATIADKNRAQKQLDIQNAKKAALDKQEAEQKEIWNIATSVASNTANFKATAKYATAAVALQAIQKATTKEEALRIAVETGLTGSTASGKSEIIGTAGSGYYMVTYDNNGKIIKQVPVGSNGGGGGTGTEGSATTLAALAKNYGITRSLSADKGYNFYDKAGQPISIQDINTKYGTSFATLLAGSDNPTDKLKITGLTDTDIYNIEQSINEFGLDETIGGGSGLTPQQADLIKQLYGK